MSVEEAKLRKLSYDEIQALETPIVREMVATRSSRN
jgi:hypothetical protein